VVTARTPYQFQFFKFFCEQLEEAAALSSPKPALAFPVQLIEYQGRPHEKLHSELTFNPGRCCISATSAEGEA
jgi:hypothetical protein